MGFWLASHLVCEPCIERRGAEAPQFTYLDSCDLPLARHLLESLGVDFKQGSCLIAVKQLFEGSYKRLCWTRPA